MTLILGLLIISFLVTGILIIPFINLLYHLRFQRAKQITKDAFGKLTPIFDMFHSTKAGTPVGGGLLVIIVVSLLFFSALAVLNILDFDIAFNHPIRDEVNIIFFTFLSFGLLGLYDDIMKFFAVDRNKFFGLRLRHKFIIQWILALIAASMLYFKLQIDILNIPYWGVLHLSWGYIPFAATIIVAFANAVNITDGLDGLASGVLMICLFAFWVLSASILDTPLSMFVALWIGSLIAFLYFNTYPARIFLGDVGSLAFGATLAVVGLLIGKVLALVIIGGVFVIEVATSLIQLTAKKYFNRKVFPVAPFHLWLQLIGWEEPKIVFRLWLASIMLAVFGLFLGLV